MLLSVQRNDTKHVFQSCLKKCLYFSDLFASFLGSHATLLVPGTYRGRRIVPQLDSIDRSPPLGYVRLDCDSSLHLKRLHLYDMSLPVVLSQAGGTTVFMDRL